MRCHVTSRFCIGSLLCGAVLSAFSSFTIIWGRESWLLYFNWAVEWDFQQCGILTSVDSNEPVRTPLKLRISKWCSVSSLTLIEYSGDLQELWSDCAYAQADLRLCWSHIPHCWKSHVTVQYCRVAVYALCLFLMVQWVALWSVSVAFPEHTNLFVSCLAFWYIAFCCCCFLHENSKGTNQYVHTHGLISQGVVCSCDCGISWSYSLTIFI